MRFCWPRGEEVVRRLLAGRLKDNLKVNDRYCCPKIDLIYTGRQAEPWPKVLMELYQ